MIKAIFPTGVTAMTVNGLHQWDYGQKLEIRAAGLPTLLEVHFSCANMEDAVVRACSVVDGAATAAIPDRCLEQSGPVTAWVYEIGETSGTTILTLTLPIIARARPQLTESIPTDISDKYTEAVAAMNAAAAEVSGVVDAVNETVRQMEAGEIKVASAAHADATAAVTLQPLITESAGVTEVPINEPGLYVVVSANSEVYGSRCTGTICLPVLTIDTQSELYSVYDDGNEEQVRIALKYVAADKVLRAVRSWGVGGSSNNEKIYAAYKIAAI